VNRGRDDVTDTRTEEQKHADRSNVYVGDELVYTLDDYWNAPSGVGPTRR
jgi:hypothetical protein